MRNINNLHKSPAFTIGVIICTFTGILYSMHFSKYNDIFIKNIFEKASDSKLEKYSKFENEDREIKLDINSSDYTNYPFGSVPVKVVLGKIKKIENPYLPMLHLAFLEENFSYVSLNYNQLYYD